MKTGSVTHPSNAPWPLVRVLKDGIEPGRLPRMWQEVSQGLGGSRAARGPAFWLGVGSGAAFGCVAIALAVLLVSAPRSSPPVGALMMDSGAPFSSLDARTAPRPREVRFQDGSSITGYPGSVVRAMAMTPTEVVLLVRQGRARFSVVPGGPRRWSVEVGIAAVEVVGTVFFVDRDQSRLVVTVDRGAVLVRSRAMPDGVRRVSAGEKAEIRVEGDGPSRREPEPEAKEPPDKPGVKTVVSPKHRLERPSESVSSAEDRDIDSLLARADKARVSGDVAEAQTLLSRIVREYPADPRSAVCTFHLGVLQLERLGRPREAAATFRKALGMASAASLREDSTLRLVQAEMASGDPASARQVAEEYLSSHPRGRHRDAIQRLVPESSPPAE